MKDSEIRAQLLRSGNVRDLGITARHRLGKTARAKLARQLKRQSQQAANADTGKKG